MALALMDRHAVEGVQGSSKVGTGGELRAGSAGIEGILPSFEGGTPSIPGYSRRARDQYGETQTPDGDF